MDCAKVAGSRADIPEDHQRRGTPRPTFTQIGALSALANRVELMVVDQRPNGGVARPAGQFCSKPGRFTGGVHHDEGTLLTIVEQT